MKSHSRLSSSSFSSRALLTATVLFTVCFSFDSALAAPKPAGKKMPRSSIFSVQDNNGKDIKCAILRGMPRSGSYKKGYFLSNQDSYKSLQKEYKKSEGKEKAKLKKKLNTLATKVSTQDSLCSDGPDGLAKLARPLTEADIRYLYEKAALGAPPAAAYTIGLTQGIEALVDFIMTYRPEPWIDADAAKYLDEIFAEDSDDVTQRGVQQWALYYLINTQNPYHERFAFLFLHNLLATSMEALDTSEKYPLMVQHLQRMRSAAGHGDYRLLLKQISRDPVMLYWLNGNQNTKYEPNENFARELMELFTISPTNPDGVPNYSEQTVAEVAKACTGWRVQQVSIGGGRSLYSPTYVDGLHTSGPKVIFEGTPWQGLVDTDFDVIDHILNQHPNAPIYLATRIAQEYLNETPSRDVVNKLAKIMKASNYNFNAVMKKLLMSAEMFAPANKNSIVSGPVERVVRFLRMTAIPYRLDTVQRDLEVAGQVIGMPPTVFGWNNNEWATGPWLLNLNNTLVRVLRNDSHFTTPTVNFSYAKLLPSPAATTADMLYHLPLVLNIELAPAQHSAMTGYMNTRYQSGTVSDFPWDPANSTKVRRKVAGVLEMLTRTLDFQMR